VSRLSQSALCRFVHARDLSSKLVLLVIGRGSKATFTPFRLRGGRAVSQTHLGGSRFGVVQSDDRQPRLRYEPTWLCGDNRCSFDRAQRSTFAKSSREFYCGAVVTFIAVASRLHRTAARLSTVSGDSPSERTIGYAPILMTFIGVSARNLFVSLSVRLDA